MWYKITLSWHPIGIAAKMIIRVRRYDLIREIDSIVDCNTFTEKNRHALLLLNKDYKHNPSILRRIMINPSKMQKIAFTILRRFINLWVQIELTYCVVCYRGTTQCIIKYSTMASIHPRNLFHIALINHNLYPCMGHDL